MLEIYGICNIVRASLADTELSAIQEPGRFPAIC